MAVSGSLIYVDNSTDPPQGISISEVSTVLGVASLDLGTLCKSSNINKWAKYKPFRNPSLHFTTDDGSSGTYLTDYEKARKASLYGFSTTPNRQSTLDTPLVSFSGNTMQNVSSGFVYSNPEGGSSSEPYRLLDFNNYIHTAVMGFKMGLDSVYYNSDNTAVMYFGVGITNFDSRYCLTPQDIMYMSHSDKMLGLLISCPDSDTRYFISTGKTISDVKGNVAPVAFTGSSSSSSDAIYLPLLSSWIGKTVTVAAVLAPSSYTGDSSHSQGWKLYTWTPTTMPDCYSLEFEENLDRVSKTCSADESGMDLNLLTYSTYATPAAGVKGSVTSGNEWKYFSSLSQFVGRFTAGTGWSSTAKTVYYKLEINPDSYAMLLNSRDITSGSTLTISESGSFSIAQGGTGDTSHTFATNDTLFENTASGTVKKAVLNVTITLYTGPNQTGSSRVFTDTLTIGTWS